MKVLISIVLILFNYLGFSRDFNSTIQIKDHLIINSTSNNKIDTIVYAALVCSGLNPIVITIKQSDKKNFNGYVIGKDNIYHLFINSNLHTNELINIIAHEMIHIKQLYNKELIINNNRYIYYKGQSYIVDKFYDINNPWEFEAYEQQDKLIIKIKKYLYTKTNNTNEKEKN